MLEKALQLASPLAMLLREKEIQQPLDALRGLAIIGLKANNTRTLRIYSLNVLRKKTMKTSHIDSM